MLKLSGSEIDFFALKIGEYLEEVPLYYVEEILELAYEDRRKEGDIDGIDTSSSEEEKSSSSDENKSSSSDENNSSDSD